MFVPDVERSDLSNVKRVWMHPRFFICSPDSLTILVVFGVMVTCSCFLISRAVSSFIKFKFAPVSTKTVIGALFILALIIIDIHLSPTGHIISSLVIIVVSVCSLDTLFPKSCLFVSRNFCSFSYMFFVGIFIIVERVFCIAFMSVSLCNLASFLSNLVVSLPTFVGIGIRNCDGFYNFLGLDSCFHNLLNGLFSGSIVLLYFSAIADSVSWYLEMWAKWSVVVFL